MDVLFEEIEERHKKSLAQMEGIAKMMDFKAKAKDSVLVKASTQTDFDADA